MKIKIILALILITASIVSCTKLQETVYDTPSVGNSLVTTTDVSLSLNGTYGLLEHLNMYKKECVKLMELCSDQMSSTTAEFTPFSQKIYEPGNGTISTVYSYYYNVINNCNFLLKKLPAMGIDSTFKVRAEGEVRFIRAFAYFDMVRLFGAIPLRTESTDITKDFYVGRDSVEKIYTLIFSDLRTATQKLLPRTSGVISGLGLANRGAAYGMLALANLTYGNYLDQKGLASTEAYTNAKGFADSVITSNQYTLAANYADLWDVEKEATAYTTEVIFGIRFTRDKNGSSSSAKGSEYAARFMPPVMQGVTGNIATNGVGSGSYRVQPWFYDYCTSGDFVGDYRSEATFLNIFPKGGTSTAIYVTYPIIPVTGQSVEVTTANVVDGRQPYIKKYIDGKGLDASNHENDMYIMRLSEVYLIKAEAENELNGPSSDAYTAFNMLRARARKANGTTRTTPADLKTGLSKDQFRTKIFDERGLEFIGECKRWFDMVRMKSPSGTGTMYQYMFQTYLPTVVPGLPRWNSTSKKWEGGKTENFSIAPYNSKFLLFPIPQREIDLNSKLTQNPGY
jgi:hypothetical protein